jgi:RNA polymerase sigma factor (sigma-70 family)
MLASDAAQETFIRAWKSMDSLKEKAAVGGWLSKIAIRTSYEILKREKRGVVLQDLDSVEARIRIKDNNTLSDFEKRDLSDWLISGLKAEYRTLIHLRFTEELSYKEIEDRTGLSPSAVKVGLHRARQIMREKYNAGKSK